MPYQLLRLEVVNGSLKGQVVVVRDRGNIVVGRLPECGLSLPNDLTVSREHFRIDFQSPKCRLTHLSRTGDTQVNGLAVTEAELQKGDEISFGDGNTVRVSFEEGREPLGTATAVVSQSVPKITNGFTVSKASCGWNLYESPNDTPDYIKLLEILIGSQRVSAVADFGRIGVPVPADLKEQHYLFPWIQAPIRDQRSPVLTSVSNHPSMIEILKTSLGKDGIVCFGSKLQGSEMASHWKKAIGVIGEEPGSAMTCYFWPSILNLILTCQRPEDLTLLLGGLTWIYLEVPKSPAKWRLFTKDDFSPILTKAGLLVIEPPKPTP